MVATTPLALTVARANYDLSVPFSSGQWLLLASKRSVEIPRLPLFIGAMVAMRSEPDAVKCIFQSPFHRGNGCYSKQSVILALIFAFSPLFIGAMVATLETSRLNVHNMVAPYMVFQSPFHRGNGCYGKSLGGVCMNIA